MELSGRRFSQLVVFVFLSGSMNVALANSKSCVPALTKAVAENVPSDPAKFVPWLVDYVKELTHDPSVPKQVRQMLREGLKRKNLTIAELTDLVRKERKIVGDPAATTKYALQGIDTSEGHTYVAFPSNYKIEGARPRDPAVFAQNNPKLRSYAHPATLLSHELAHIRMMGFLDRNFQVLAPKLPEWMRYQYQGHWFLRADVWKYLDERYAHEMEFKLFKSQKDTRFKSNVIRYINEFGFDPEREQNDEEIRQNISDHVLKRLGITDPRFKQLGKVPLGKILMGFDAQR